MDAILQWLLTYVQSNPNFAVVLMVMGFLRLVFKPLMALVQAVVDATPTDKDNAKLEEVKASKFYTSLLWLLDYFASVKVPK